jgi:hypothetical protein
LTTPPSKTHAITAHILSLEQMSSPKKSVTAPKNVDYFSQGNDHAILFNFKPGVYITGRIHLKEAFKLHKYVDLGVCSTIITASLTFPIPNSI